MVGGLAVVTSSTPSALGLPKKKTMCVYKIFRVQNLKRKIKEKTFLGYILSFSSHAFLTLSSPLAIASCFLRLLLLPGVGAPLDG